MLLTGTTYGEGCIQRRPDEVCDTFAFKPCGRFGVVQQHSGHAMASHRPNFSVRHGRNHRATFDYLVLALPRFPQAGKKKRLVVR